MNEPGLLRWVRLSDMQQKRRWHLSFGDGLTICDAAVPEPTESRALAAGPPDAMSGWTYSGIAICSACRTEIGIRVGIRL